MTSEQQAKEQRQILFGIYIQLSVGNKVKIIDILGDFSEATGEDIQMLREQLKVCIDMDTVVIANVQSLMVEIEDETNNTTTE